MQKLAILILLCFTATFTQAQPQLTAEQWQQDLRHLQKLIHNDYDHLFRQIPAEAFDKEVEKLHQQIPELETHEIIIGLAKIVALFKMGHTSMPLNIWHAGDDSKTGFHNLPYGLYHFSDGLYVQGVRKGYDKALGARVLRIGDTPVEEAMQLVKPAVSAENEQFFKAYGMSHLSCPEVLEACGVTDQLDNVTLLLEKDGATFSMTFPAMKMNSRPTHYGFIPTSGEWLGVRDTTGTPPLWLRHLNKIYYFEYLPDTKTVYVRQSQIQDDPSENIPDFYKRVFDFVDSNEVERFILDVRLNGGGNNYKNRPIIVGLIQAEKINQPGKLFVVIGRRTFSACQNLVNEIEKYTEVTFVGEPTAENVNFFGDNRREVLPNSQLPVYLSFLWWQNHDPRDTRPWTAPQLAVDLSFEDYRTNHDPVLDAIYNSEVQASQYGQRSQVEEKIIGLFMKGNYEEAKALAKEHLGNPERKGLSYERQINEFGYQFLKNNNPEGAIHVFTLNTELYPESANTWDSLGEAYLASGNLKKAKIYYVKALTMDPDGEVGASAKKMLEKIRGMEKE